MPELGNETNNTGGKVQEMAAHELAIIYVPKLNEINER
jgi:hypothetical protein